MSNKYPNMKIISLEDFMNKCKQGRCLGQTIKSKVCQKESKQEDCYKKYVKQQEKKYEKQFVDKDYEWESLKDEIKLRDNNQCMVMKILTIQQIKEVEKQDGFWLSQKYLDGAHIIPRATCPQHVYNRKNVLLVSRFFHTRLDNYLDLISGEFIGMEGMALWWTHIMRMNKRWPDNYTYWNFRKELLES